MDNTSSNNDSHGNSNSRISVVVDAAKDAVKVAAIYGTCAGVVSRPYAAAALANGIVTQTTTALSVMGGVAGVVVPACVGVAVASGIVGAAMGGVMAGYRCVTGSKINKTTKTATTTSIPPDISMTVATMKEYPNNRDVQFSGCRKLRDLADTSDVDYQVLAESGFVQAVSSAMKTHGNDEDIQKQGRKALDAFVQAFARQVVSSVDEVVEVDVTVDDDESTNNGRLPCAVNNIVVLAPPPDSETVYAVPINDLFQVNEEDCVLVPACIDDSDEVEVKGANDSCP